MRPFLPSPRQTNLLIVLGFTLFGAAIYARYTFLESDALAAACLAGSPRAGCGVRRLLTDLSEIHVFGGLALIAAAAHVWRPRVATLICGLAAGIPGLVFGNAEPSSLALALLILGFARPARASTLPPEREMRQPSTTPASSKTTH